MSVARLSSVATLTAFRQFVTGLSTLLIYGLASRSLSPIDLGGASKLVVLSLLINAWTALPIYPVVYRSLATDENRLWPLLKFAAPLGAVLSLGTAAGLFMWAPSGLSVSSLDLIAFALLHYLSVVLPCFALGLARYRFYNAGECIPAIASGIFAAIWPMREAADLLWILAAGFAVKSAWYACGFLWLRRLPETTTSHVSIAEELLAGMKVGIVGAVQGLIYRLAFFVAGAIVDPVIAALLAACWPVAEKSLVVPQAVNTVMFGELRRGKGRGELVRLYSLFTLAAILAAGSLCLVAWAAESWYLPREYTGVAKVMVFTQFILVVHGVRIMSQTLLTAIDGWKAVILDAVALASLLGLTLQLNAVSQAAARNLFFGAILASAFLLVTAAVRGARAVS